MGSRSDPAVNAARSAGQVSGAVHCCWSRCNSPDLRYSSPIYRLIAIGAGVGPLGGMRIPQRFESRDSGDLKFRL